MADQDNKSKMAIPNQPKDLARKLVKTPAEDIANYVLGDAAKAGVKKFGSAHPALRRNQPNQSPEENENTFDGGIVKDDTTRRADYEAGEDEAAYRNGHGETNKDKIKKKVAESFVARAARKVKVEPVNAQKKGAMTTHGSEHETSEVAGDETSQPQQKKPHVKIPPQVVTNEQVLTELGEPMAPAPATSDSPGLSGQSSPADQPGMGNDGSNKNTDSDVGDDDSTEGADETVMAAREHLEVIATQAAELYENIEDDAELPDWIIEKLELAKNFINSVAKYISDTKDEQGDDADDEEDAAASNKNNTDTAKPSAFKGNGEQALAKESNDIPFDGPYQKPTSKTHLKKLARKAMNNAGGSSGKEIAGKILNKISKAHGV
jgi:hypothetical protein